MSVWENIVFIVGDEFSDIKDVDSIVRVVIRLLMATLLGGVLGYEREQQGKAAGLRTHILVCVGAALFVVGGVASGAMDDAMSRIIQGIVAGVGFLCAGSIIKSNKPSDVHGLTTAAGIWFTAAIGVVVGLGQIATGIFATILAVLVLHCLPLVVEPGKDNDH